MWSIYQFFLKDRDEKFKKTVGDIQSATREQYDNVLGQVKSLESRLSVQDKSFNDMRVTIASLMSQVKSQGQSFNATTSRVEKVLDRHEEKLDNFGKVIIKN